MPHMCSKTHSEHCGHLKNVLKRLISKVLYATKRGRYENMLIESFTSQGFFFLMEYRISCLKKTN